MLQRNRLRHVRERAHRHGRGLERRVGAAGDHDDADGRIERSNALEYLHAVETLHDDVEDHDVRLVLRHRDEGIAAGDAASTVYPASVKYFVRMVTRSGSSSTTRIRPRG